jgi:hypothetical protein
MRAKARGLTKYGGPPGWLEDCGLAGCDFVRSGWSKSLALTDQTTCPGLGLIYY